MPKVQSISKSNFAWNSLRKEHHIAHVAAMLRRKNTLNEGGGSAKSDIIFMGGSAKSDLGWHEGGGVKNLKKKGWRPLWTAPLSIYLNFIFSTFFGLGHIFLFPSIPTLAVANWSWPMSAGIHVRQHIDLIFAIVAIHVGQHKDLIFAHVKSI